MTTDNNADRCGATVSGCRMLDFCALPDDCIATVISFTSPIDACRLSLVSTLFKSAAESDTVWAKFLPSDYQNIVPESPSVSSKKDLYLSLCENPVLIEDGKKSLSLDKESGKKCFMLAARDLTIVWSDTPTYWKWISLPDSRFPEVAELISVCWFEIRGMIDTGMLSPMTRYKAYLVFKTTMSVYGFEYQPVEVIVGLVGSEASKRTVYVDIERERQHRQWIRPRSFGIFQHRLRGIRLPDYVPPAPRGNMDQHPKERGDGWSEVDLGEFFNVEGKDGELQISILQTAGHWKGGLVIQGIEIRPVSSKQIIV